MASKVASAIASAIQRMDSGFQGMVESQWALMTLVLLHRAAMDRAYLRDLTEALAEIAKNPKAGKRG